ncbi:MAG: helix-turn-helix domain-containing protein [Amnibacterium sp.]
MSVVSDSLSTSDPGEAERFVQRIYPLARIQESRRPFSYAHRVRGDERVRFAWFSVSAWTEFAVGFDGVIGVGHLLGGRYRATSNGEAIDPTGPFLLRPGESRSQSERLDLLMINLDEQAFGRFAGSSRGLDQARLGFPGVAPLPRMASHWSHAARYVQGLFETPELIGNELLRSAAVDLLYAAALAAFPVDVDGGTRPAPPDTALPRAVRRALAYIDDNVDRGVSVEELAAAARLSIRGLQAAFQRHLGTTPTVALRAARLSAAHADLVRADPSVDTVAGVARRWGFHHLGRFAAEYRAQYGELPRDTLRR